MYEELIKALRHCDVERECKGCPYYSGAERDIRCKEMEHNAADAIEELKAAKCPHYIRNVHDRGDDNLACDNGNQFKPITNSDRIRSMTDKELARFLYIKTCEDGYPQFDNIPKWLDWLKQEVMPMS